MSQELERRPQQDVEATWRIAKGFALSGYFPDAKSAEQAFVKVMAGAEMGLAPFQAMTGIHIISGKPVVGAGLLAAMLDQAPGYHYETEWEPDQADAKACTVVIFKGGEERGRSRFSLEDAQRAGLSQPNWKKFPSNMLFARAMSNAVRWYAPGLTGQSVYVEGELDPAPLPSEVLITEVQDVLDAVEVDPDDDLPFEVAAPAPREAESPQASGQSAANEPAAGTGGGLLDTLDDALRFVNTLEAAQLEALASLLHCARPITRRALAGELIDQRQGWATNEILKEIS